jgi:anti-sigma factor RsiW
MSDLIRRDHPANSEAHVTAWLGAYLDGEISASHREEIEAHLSMCYLCQAELESLEQLADLLQTDPPLARYTSDSVFVRQVMQRISRPAVPGWQHFLQLSWRLAPFFIFAVWAFFQAVSWVSSVVLIGIGWVPEMKDAFQALEPLANTGGGTWWNDLLQMSLLNSGVNRAAASFAWLEPSAVMILIDLALLTVLAVLFVSWLASWWAYHRSKA